MDFAKLNLLDYCNYTPLLEVPRKIFSRFGNVLPCATAFSAILRRWRSIRVNHRILAGFTANFNRISAHSTLARGKRYRLSFTSIKCYWDRILCNARGKLGDWFFEKDHIIFAIGIAFISHSDCYCYRLTEISLNRSDGQLIQDDVS